MAPHMEIPFLPGCQYNAPNGRQSTKKPGQTVTVPRQPYTRQFGSLGVTTAHDSFKKPELDTVDLPIWDAMDRHVLRFKGYYQEAVNDSNLENCRHRHVVMYYYLEDETVAITEPKIDNSGLSQGLRVRRQPLKKSDGTPVTPSDFRVGEKFNCYSVDYHLTDCDKFTQDYYAVHPSGAQHVDQEPMPSDAFDNVEHKFDHIEKDFNKADEKMYREKMLGGGCPNGQLGQFLKEDRHVLRFYAVMDDLFTPQYERRPFTLMYFLSDKTLEIRETYIDGCGRDSFPRFFKRAKMALEFKVQSPIDPVLRDDECVAPQHFSIGDNLSLGGNTFYIYDADGFTREFYGDKSNGLDALAPAADVKLPERVQPRPSTPPYTGYGSWDDSMASVLNLVPKVPKKDFLKLFQNDGKVLRFMGRFVNPAQEDKDREFLFLYFLHNDTMMIHEPPQRNSGIMGGRFLEQGVHMNQLKEKSVTKYDLRPGNIVQFNKHQFLMTEMDEYTRMHFDEDGSHFQFDLMAVLERLRTALAQSSANITEVFRRFDLDSNGVVTIDEFQACLNHYNFKMRDHEVLALMRHFDSQIDGQISYNEFCDIVLARDYHEGAMPPTQTLDKSDLHDYKEKCMAKALDRMETTKVREAVRAVGACICGKIGRGIRLMKECSSVNDNAYVADAEIKDALSRMGFNFELDDIRRTALYLGHTDLQAIDTNKFRQDVETTYHDMCAAR